METEGHIVLTHMYIVIEIWHAKKKINLKA